LVVSRLRPAPMIKCRKHHGVESAGSSEKLHIIWQRNDGGSESDSSASGLSSGDANAAGANGRLRRKLAARQIDFDDVSLRESSESGFSTDSELEELQPAVGVTARSSFNQARDQHPLSEGFPADNGDTEGGGRDVLPPTEPASYEMGFADVQEQQRILAEITAELALSSGGESDHEGEEAGEPESELQPSRSELTSELLAKIPLDSRGVLTSIGSIGHASASCTECVFLSRGFCVNGINCNYCHFPHRQGPKRRNKLRPCKGKRDRYRKLVTRLNRLIECDPYNFDIEKVSLPPSIETNPLMKEKLIVKMNAFAEKVRAGQLAIPEAPVRRIGEQSHPLPAGRLLEGQLGNTAVASTGSSMGSTAVASSASTVPTPILATGPLLEETARPVPGLMSASASAIRHVVRDPAWQHLLEGEYPQWPLPHVPVPQLVPGVLPGPVRDEQHPSLLPWGRSNEPLPPTTMLSQADFNDCHFESARRGTAYSYSSISL